MAIAVLFGPTVPILCEFFDITFAERQIVKQGLYVRYLSNLSVSPADAILFILCFTGICRNIFYIHKTFNSISPAFYLNPTDLNLSSCGDIINQCS